MLKFLKFPKELLDEVINYLPIKLRIQLLFPKILKKSSTKDLGVNSDNWNYIWDAASDGHLDIVNYLHKNKIEVDTICKDDYQVNNSCYENEDKNLIRIIKKTIDNYHYDIIEFFATVFLNSNPDTIFSFKSIIEYSIKSNDIIIVRLLLENITDRKLLIDGIPINMYFNYYLELSEEPLKEDNLPLIKLLYYYKIRYDDGINKAIKYNSKHILKWYISMNLKYDQKSMSYAIRYGDLEMVKYLYNTGAECDDKSIQLALECSRFEHSNLNLKLVEFLYNHYNVTRTANSIRLAISLFYYHSCYDSDIISKLAELVNGRLNYTYEIISHDYYNMDLDPFLAKHFNIYKDNHNYIFWYPKKEYYL
jgi:hypothetical protein